jgi:DNA-binding MarR family transcriptional regulator
MQIISMKQSEKEDVSRIVEAVVYLYTESRRVTKEVARHYGLTGPQVTALKLLRAVDAISLSKLSARMSAKNSTITGIVDRMERRDLVRRIRSERDRRVILLHLTDVGRELADSIPVSSMEIFAEALGALSGADRDELRRILNEVSERVRLEVDRREKKEFQSVSRG